MKTESDEGARPEPGMGRQPSKPRASGDCAGEALDSLSGEGASRSRPRIVVERADVGANTATKEEPPIHVHLPAIQEASAVGQLAVPSSVELDVILARAETGDDIAGVERMAAACIDLAKHCDQLKGRLAEFSILRLRSRRRLGLVLLQTDRRGGDRSKWLGATLLDRGLPRGVDPTTAKKCRNLARMRDEVIEAYFTRAAASGKVPSESGALRFAAGVPWENGNERAKQRRARKSKPAAGGALIVPPEILDSLQRLFGDIDVCVGEAKVKCRSKQNASTLREKDLHGSVLILQCHDPASWLPKLAQMRRSSKIDEAVVILPADTAALWFKDLVTDDWVLCFPCSVQPALLLAHLGHHHLFAVKFAEIGSIVRPYIGAGSIRVDG